MKLNEQDGAEDLKKLDHKLTAEFAVSLALKKKKLFQFQWTGPVALLHLGLLEVPDTRSVCFFRYSENGPFSSAMSAELHHCALYFPQLIAFH